jgi:hypothetical protein
VSLVRMIASFLARRRQQRACERLEQIVAETKAMYETRDGTPSVAQLLSRARRQGGVRFLPAFHFAEPCKVGKVAILIGGAA